MLGGTEGVGAQHAAPLRFSVSAPLLFLVHIPLPCTGPIAYDRLHMTDLKRSLRLVDGLAMVVGMTVGAGIFRTPGIVAARLGRPGLTFVVWVLGAGLAFLGALCFAELTTRQPRAAGKYAFVREAFGTRAGFVVGWVEALGTTAWRSPRSAWPRGSSSCACSLGRPRSSRRSAQGWSRCSPASTWWASRRDGGCRTW